MKNVSAYFAIAQVHYNPISLEIYLAKIREKFRLAGYTDFEKKEFTTFDIASISAPHPITQQSQYYVFSNMDGSSSFVLNQNALSFQTTNYSTFEMFSNTLFQGLEIVHKTVISGLDFSEQIGMRFLNAVIPKTAETLHQYLIPEVLGLYGKLEGRSVRAFSESLNQTASNVSLISRVIIHEGPLGFPPDLQPIKGQTGSHFLKTVGIHATIDIDAVHKARELFKLENLNSCLRVLHDETRKTLKTIRKG